jgi:ribonucleoside-diphosphate reductase alpha chain
MRGLLNAFATAISIGLQYGVPLDVFVRKFSYMRFEPEGMTQNPEIPFAKSLPDYIMRWVASRFIEDAETLEDLGILTPEVRAKREAETSQLGLGIPTDTAGPSNGGNGGAKKPVAAAEALTETPPVRPAKMSGGDLGPACEQCGGMMQRTGSCYTCSSCGNNTGCG